MRPPGVELTDDPSLPTTANDSDAPGAAAAAGLPADREGWQAALVRIADDTGYFETLGGEHGALFTDEGTTLLVTFEEGGAVRAHGPERLPQGLALARLHGWSQLSLIAEGPTWFRAAPVYRFFDRLVDDAFFEDFDRVLFYGAGMGAYAAAAFSVVAPGATVLMIQPRATLDPAVAGWDTRDRAARRLNFTDRYGYAPDMIEGAGKGFVIFDPLELPDAMHAALFRKPYVTALRARRLGGRLETVLQRFGVLDELILAAMEDRLTVPVFARAIRMRRQFGPYLKRMLSLAGAAGRPGHQAMICRSVVARRRAPQFRRRLEELSAGG